MKVHLRQIPAAGLHLEGEEDCALADLEIAEVKCAGPLSYSLDLGISENALWANGRLAQPVELTCVSCLEKFVHTIVVPDFALLNEPGGPETVDLAPFVREDLLLNLPAYPHCDVHGGRICKAAKLEENRAAKEDGKRAPDWSALDQLHLD